MKGLYVQYGCGFCAPEGWMNFDASPTLRFERLPFLGKLYTKNAKRFPQNVCYGDIVRGLPIPPGSCNGIYCSHVLEHLALREFELALAHSYSYLRRSGIFRLVVPDLETLAKNYVGDSAPDAAERFMTATGLGTLQRPRSFSAFCRAWLGSAHYWMWDYRSLASRLEKSGFQQIRRSAYGDCEDSMFQTVEDPGRFEKAVAIECRK